MSGYPSFFDSLDASFNDSLMIRSKASEAKSLEQARKRHIVTLLGGFESNAYQHLSGKTFRQIGGDFKDCFEVPRYDALPLSKFDEGMSYIKAWQLPTNLALQVRDFNLQTELEA